MLRRVFFSESVPFAITLLVGALGWFVTRYVDRVSAAPILEYEFSMREDSKGQQTISVALANLTEATSFSDLEFTLLSHGPSSKFTDASIRVLPPAWEGDIKEPIPEGQSASFKIPKLQPGGRMTLEAACQNCGRVTFHLRSSSSALRMLEPSLSTFFLRYEPFVLGGLLILWAALLLAVGRQEERKDAPYWTFSL